METGFGHTPADPQQPSSLADLWYGDGVWAAYTEASDLIGEWPTYQDAIIALAGDYGYVDNVPEKHGW